MGDMAPPSMVATSTTVVSIATKVMIAATIALFFMIAFIVFLHLYAKWHWSRNEDPTIVSWRRRTARQLARRRGLDPTALQSLPVVVFNPSDFKDGLECAVCLSEVLEGEKVRLLPKCNHGFHVDCIDMWFQSHSTCPLCRNPVISCENTNIEFQEGATSTSSQSDNDDDYDGDDDDYDDDDDDASSNASIHSREIPVFPTNVLYWGNQTQVTSATSSNNVGVDRPRDGLVIEIPRELCEEEAKSPVVSRLRSLKRLLSRGKRVAPSPCASSSGDIERV